MPERSLNERLVDLEDRLFSVSNLTRHGTANELRFYIFDYNPKDELIIRREVEKLKKRNPDIIIRIPLFSVNYASMTGIQCETGIPFARKASSSASRSD